MAALPLSSARALRSHVRRYATQTPHHNLEQLKDPSLIRVGSSCPLRPEGNVSVFRDVISAEEHDMLVKEIDVGGTDESIKRFRKRKYASDHWDSVITGYKELERPLTSWNSMNARTLERIQAQLQMLINSNAVWLPPHIIDLDKSGEILPHVDSVKHSDKIVAGLSLLTTRRMVLHADEADKCVEESLTMEISLPPCSLYLLEAKARYSMAHSIPKREGDERRLSIIFRDDMPPPWAR